MGSSNMTTEERIRELVRHFSGCLKHFETIDPFSAPMQYESHARSVALRKKFSNAAEALDNDEFLTSIRSTLVAWRMNQRGARLAETAAFITAIRKWKREIIQLERISLESAREKMLIRYGVLYVRWRLVRPIPSSWRERKALHHLFPELVVPIDRDNTGWFIGRMPERIQTPAQQEVTFRVAFEAFVKISAAAKPAEYVGTHRWHTSGTKVVDNAIVGYTKRVKQKVRDSSLRSE
jgi:hypothetical protein